MLLKRLTLNNTKEWKRQKASVQKVLKTSSKLPSNSVGKGAGGSGTEDMALAQMLLLRSPRLKVTLTLELRTQIVQHGGLGQFINSTGRQYGLRRMTAVIAYKHRAMHWRGLPKTILTILKAA